MTIERVMLASIVVVLVGVGLCTMATLRGWF